MSKGKNVKKIFISVLLFFHEKLLIAYNNFTKVWTMAG
jgi:hypothetical protein